MDPDDPRRGGGSDVSLGFGGGTAPFLQKAFLGHEFRQLVTLSLRLWKTASSKLASIQACDAKIESRDGMRVHRNQLPHFSHKLIMSAKLPQSPGHAEYCTSDRTTCRSLAKGRMASSTCKNTASRKRSKLNATNMPKPNQATHSLPHDPCDCPITPDALFQRWPAAQPPSDPKQRRAAGLHFGK